MTFAVTAQTLYDGERSCVMQFTGISDGEGEEQNVAKVVAADLLPAPGVLSILKIQYDVAGGILRLLWAADDPVPFLDLSTSGVLEYEKIGGLPNPRPDGYNGDILFTTLGFEAGSSYSATLEMKKKP